jgi:hypothetical protein
MGIRNTDYNINYYPVTLPHRYVCMVDGYDPDLDISKPFTDPGPVPSADP